MPSKQRTCQNILAVLAIAAFAVFSTSAAQAANQYRVSIKAAHSTIPVFSAQSVEIMADSTGSAGAGMAMGRRQHKPIRIIKEWGASSPQLQRAMVTNETFPEVVIEEVGNNGQVVRTMRLSHVSVTKLVKSGGAGSAAAGRGDKEEVNLNYEKIEILTPSKGRIISPGALKVRR